MIDKYYNFDPLCGWGLYAGVSRGCVGRKVRECFWKNSRMINEQWQCSSLLRFIVSWRHGINGQVDERPKNGFNWGEKTLEDSENDSKSIMRILFDGYLNGWWRCWPMKMTNNLILWLTKYLCLWFLFQIIWMVTRTWTDKIRAEVVTEIQRIDREIRKLPFFLRIC